MHNWQYDYNAVWYEKLTFFVVAFVAYAVRGKHVE
jgi:hypothetical protein